MASLALAAGLLSAGTVGADPIAVSPVITEPDTTTAPQREAKVLFDQGVDAYRAGRYDAAIAAFAAADSLAPRPQNAYNIARAYERLNQRASAVDFYRRYLASEPKATNGDEVRRKIAELEAVPAVTGAAGDTPARDAVSADAKAHLATTTPAVPGLDGDPAAHPVLTPMASGSAADPRESRPRRGARPAVMIAGGTLTLIGIGTGVAFEIAARHQDDKLSDYRRNLGPSGCGTASPPPECEELKDAAERYDLNRNLALAGFATASAAAIGTFVYWLLTDTPAASQGSAAPSVGGLELDGAFTSSGALLGIRGNY